MRSSSPEKGFRLTPLSAYDCIVRAGYSELAVLFFKGIDVEALRFDPSGYLWKSTEYRSAEATQDGC